ncbi:TPA: hypothetical protein EYP44_00155 [Candidatus Bathyarchaeota archaeon]|nr:hypothetical protein [Candidatus Bathyarchaeota archaeon]
MSEVTLTLPKRLKERLEREAARQGRSLEEILVDALGEACGIDSEARAELHSELCKKYLREAGAYREEEDYVQASEKAWGAASQAVRSVAAKRGIELRSHGDLWKLVTELSKEHPEWDLLGMFHTANSLHTNFYEKWLTAEAVVRGLEIVRAFVGKLKGIT